MRVAFVYDRVNKWGGAERVLLALHKIWPDAPLYTAVYDPRRAAWAKVFDIRTSFLQVLPFARRFHEILPILTPLAFGTCMFDGFDVVISVTSAEAKNIITKPGTVHICYCLTPTRYLWSGYDEYLERPGLGVIDAIAAGMLRKTAPVLRNWDVVAAQRPDYYIAISERVKERIGKYYGREVFDVIYPPAGLGTKFQTPNSKQYHISHIKYQKKMPRDYFLTVTRLVGYKRVDIIIRAFNELGWPLVIVGDGRQKAELKRMAKGNIRFIDTYLTDDELARYYLGCRAFVYAADEDFGIAPVEAMSLGKPVIAYRQSAVAETVADGRTGILWEPQTPDALAAAVRAFDQRTFDPAIIENRAKLYSEDVFIKRIRNAVEICLKLHHESG